MLGAGIIALATGGPWLIHRFPDLAGGTLAARAEQRVVTLEVGGMSCGGCAAAVRARLVEVPGVTAAEVRLNQRRAYVVCERATADTSLTGAVRRAGPGFMAMVVAR